VVTGADADREGTLRFREDGGGLIDAGGLPRKHGAEVIRLFVDPLMGERSLLPTI
jgi:hypothetical protein